MIRGTLLRKRKLTVKIVILAALVLLATNSVGGIVYYNYTYQDILKNSYESSRDICYQINVYLTGEIQSLMRRIYAMNNNLSLYNALNIYLNERSSFNLIKIQGLICDAINEIEFGDRYIHSIVMCTPYGMFDNFTQVRRQNFIFEESPFFFYFRDNPQERTAAFPAMEHPIMSTDEAVIPLVFLLYIEWKPVYIIVFLRQWEIDNYLSHAFASLDRVFIVNREGENILNYTAADREVVSMFSGEESENANAVCREIRYLGEPYLASYTRMALSRWDIYTLKSSASLLANIGTIQKFVVLFWGLTVITGVVLAFLFSRSITRQEEQQKRIAELKALQAQIKPHFLYNTLNDISWHASDQGASEIAMMANSLGRFFRIGLSKGRELITVREELDHVLSYLVIQSIRYKSKLEYSVNIPEELKTYEIIKLVLQPLVENALYHGIKTLERKGYIRIHGKKEKSTGGIPILTFTITDNGAGMDTAKLRMINDNLSRGLIESSSGYGVYSVNERIRLYYGESYGLRLENTAGSSGICAKITIPCRSPEEAPC